MAKFLDENGVKKLWSRIQEYIYECGCNECSGGGDVGYDCTETESVLFSESGATQKMQDYSNINLASLTYTGVIRADEIKVVFNGTEYICPRTDAGYGAEEKDSEDGYVFSEYPFHIYSGSDGNAIYTENPMPFEITVSSIETATTVTPCFKKAVQAINEPLIVNLTVSPSDASTQRYSVGDRGGEQIMKALLRGQPVYLLYNPVPSDANQQGKYYPIVRFAKVPYLDGYDYLFTVLKENAEEVIYGSWWEDSTTIQSPWRAQS